MELCLLQLTQYFGAGSALVGLIASAGPVRTALTAFLDAALSLFKDMG
jgi:hypothetical protein